MDRRAFLRSGVMAGVAGSAAGAAAGAASAGAPASTAQEQPSSGRPAPLKGRLKQSVCKWCYGSMTLAELSKAAAGMGIRSVELLNEDEWPVPRQFGLTCAVANGPTSISRGWNRVEHHDEFVKGSQRLLPLVAAAGIPCMIVFSGNREGMSDSEGLRNCAAGLKRIAPLAEKAGVTVIMELLNSKVDHKDYMCDRTAWGADLVRAVGSDRFRLLYDIYHMQIMEGDVIRTIRENAKHIAHYHTAGNPGRGNLDATQELDYRGICRAIVESGFSGYLAQEFLPRGDPMKALQEAVLICDA